MSVDADPSALTVPMATGWNRLIVGHVGLTVFVSAFTMVAFSTSRLVDQPFNLTMVLALSELLVLMIVIFAGLALVYSFLQMAIVDKPARPLGHFSGKLKQFLADPQRLVSATMTIGLMSIFTAGFSYMKDAIPKLNPFSWDPAFAELDRLLFFGMDPWKLTFALFGSPVATTVINSIYHARFFVIYLFLLAAAFGTVAGRLRLTFLYSFLLTWTLGGVILASIFSSVGPVYYDRMGFGGDFEPQMQLLRQFHESSPVGALQVQEMLWQGYMSSGGMISGISAMPSMHVASSVLVTLLAFQISRPLGWALVLFTVSIFIGSVHLGWHYAVDGLVGAVVALLSWRVAAALAQFDLDWQNRILSRSYP